MQTAAARQNFRMSSGGIFPACAQSRSRRNAHFSSISATSALTYTETSCIKDSVRIDPAMGSAGFICAAAQYVSERYADALFNNENRKHYTTTMFTGFDTDQTMLRIGAMNIMLRGVDAPNIRWMDSLSEDNTDREKYSLIMANLPFKGSLDKETIAKDLTAIAPTKKD